jgi:hypothetical protein
MAKKPKRIELSDKDNDKSYGSKNDVVDGNGGNDTISGGGGNDKLMGGDGDDLLRGGSGDDRLSGQAGNDRLLGGEGDDTITAGIGNDIVDGGAGDDLIKMTGKFADATVEKDGDSYVITIGTAITTVKNVESFRFEDGTFDVKDVEAKANGSTGNTFTLTTASGENLPGTTGDDTFNAILDGADSTLNAFDVVSGGSGKDVLNLVLDQAFAIPGGSSISDIETILISAQAAAAGDIDVKAFKGATLIAQSGVVALNFIDVADGQTVKFGDGVANVDYLDAAKAAVIELDKVDSGGAIDVAGLGLTSLTISGSIAEAAPGVPGDLTITNTADDPSTVLDEGSNISKFTLNLTSSAYVDLSDLLDGEDFTTFDASGSTGGIETADFETTNFLTTIKTGSGNDKVHYDTDYTPGGAGGAKVTIDVGAGNDEVELQLYDATANSSVTVTLGAGSDTVLVTDQFENINVATSTALKDGLVSITDFKASEDVLNISDFGLTETVLSNAQLTTINGSASLFAAATAASALLVDAVDDFLVFNFGGNAYVLYDGNDTEAFDSGDGLIELVGTQVADLSATNFII